jgi:alpha-D-xyloside xylohydrolase
MRCHGKPPKEPWAYSQEFLKFFRKLMTFRYTLTPYVYGQAQLLAAEGLPMMQPMCLAFSGDPVCEGMEDQFMFGEDILVAPLFEDNATERQVYLPDGCWIDLFDGITKYQGGRYVTVPCAEWKGAALVRDGAVIPFVDPALSTEFIDWGTLRYRWYTSDKDENLMHGTVIDAVSKNASRLTKEKFKEPLLNALVSMFSTPVLAGQ